MFTNKSTKPYIMIAGLIYLMVPILQAKQSAVTYNTLGTRFGSFVFCYIKAKWVSYKYHIPLLYKPAYFSDYLLLHDVEKRYSREEAATFNKSLGITNEFISPIRKDDGILYETNVMFMPSFGDFELEYNHTQEVDNFFNEIKKLIKPRYFIKEFQIPQDVLSIAVHVRKGNGGDAPLESEQTYKVVPSDRYWPHKFPPDQFYIDQIIKLANMFQDKQLYVYIFSDYPKPQEIVELYKAKINNPRIRFDSRESFTDDVTLVEDFFAMAKFDCLIRPRSAYSVSAQLIGNHKIVVFPKKHIWQGNRLIITDVSVISRI